MTEEQPKYKKPWRIVGEPPVGDIEPIPEFPEPYVEPAPKLVQILVWVLVGAVMGALMCGIPTAILVLYLKGAL